MVNKETLHLGQLVLVGANREPAVIDGLAQTFAGVRLQGGGYEFYGYDAIQSIEDMCRDEAEKWVNVLEEAYGLKGLEVPAYV